MRRLASCALMTALGLAGCSIADPEPVVAARPFEARVASVSLGPVWDRDVFGANGPDVYVQVVAVDAPYGAVFRTVSAPDVRLSSLPLQLGVRSLLGGDYAPVPVGARVVVEVRDDDGLSEDDLMFRSDTLRFGDLDRRAARVGSTGAFSVLTTDAEFSLRFRWE